MATTLVMHYDSTTGRYFVKNIATAQIEDLAVTSAKLATAIINLLGTVADGAITSAKIASGIVGSVHLADGAVTSSDIVALAIGGGHVANQGLLSANYGANIIATPHIANQGILSASIGTGIVGDTLVKDFGLVSGKYASGSITEGALASGISIDIAELAQEPSYRAEQLVSSYLGIQFSISGYFNYAQAAGIATMPTVGLAVANILSGQIGTFQYQGRITNTAWDFSGYVGDLLFLGTSSQVTLTAPSASGQCVQRVGKVVTKDTMFLRPELSFLQIAE